MKAVLRALARTEPFLEGVLSHDPLGVRRTLAGTVPSSMLPETNKCFSNM